MANSQVIGILKALLTAETGEYTAAMKAAGAEAQELGKKLEKDLEPRQRSINKLVAEFLGGQEIRRAQEYATAIEKVGGVTALTAADQQKANRAVSEALEHYRKLGIEAPKNLRDIEAATRQVPKAMDSVGASAMKMASALGLAFSAAAIVNGVKTLIGNAIEAAGKIDDLSLKLGVSAEAVQRFSFAAKQTGTDIDGIGTAISKMNANLSGGSKDVVSMLKQIGLSFADIRGMKPEDAFVAISEAIKKIPDPMLQAEAALKLFGKSGQDLLPLMKQGITDLMSQTSVMSEDTVKRLDAAGDAWQKFGDKITIVTGEIIADGFRAWDGYSTFLNHFMATAKGFVTGGGMFGGLEASKKFLEDLGATNDKLKQTEANAKWLAEQKGLIPHALIGDPAEAAKAKAQAEAYAKAITDIVEKWNGAALAREVKKTSDAFKNLTAAQLADEKVMDRVAKDVVALAKAGAVLPPQLNEIARKQQFLTATQELAEKTTKSVTEAIKGYQAANLKAIPSVAELTAEFNKHVLSISEGVKLIDKLAGAPVKLAKAPSDMFGEDFAKDMFGALQRAVEGGGNVWASLGLVIGQKIGAEIGKALGGSAETSIANAIPIIGPMIGAIFTDISSRSKRMDAVRAQIRDLNKEILSLGGTPKEWKDKEDAFGSMVDTLTDQLNEMKAAMGRAGLTADDLGGALGHITRSAQQLISDFGILTGQGFTLEQITKGNAAALNELISAAIATGQKIPAALRPMIEQLVKSGLLSDELKRKLLGLEAEVPWQKMEDTANKYGISLEALGPKFQASKLGATASEFAADFMLLVDNGADVGAVVEKMSDKANKFLSDAKKWGIELPASMKPLLEKMIDAGTLIDDNGDKITDLKDIKFGKTLAEEFEPLLAKLDELIDVLTNGVPKAVGDMIETSNRKIGFGIRIPVSVSGPPAGFGTGDGAESGGPGFANGSGRFLNFGSGTRATLHGWEQVINTDEAQGIAGMVHQAVTSGSPNGPVTLVWKVNGRDFYRETFPDLVSVLKNGQVTR